MKKKSCFLIVDDEEDILELLSLYLGLASEEPLIFKAGDVEEALKIFEQEKDKIDVLITDIRMPGHQNGLALAEILRNKKPQIKILVISAYSDYTDEDIYKSGANFFLKKPFDTKSFINAISNLLGK